MHPFDDYSSFNRQRSFNRYPDHNEPPSDLNNRNHTANASPYNFSWTDPDLKSRTNVHSSLPLNKGRVAYSGPTRVSRLHPDKAFRPNSDPQNFHSPQRYDNVNNSLVQNGPDRSHWPEGSVSRQGPPPLPLNRERADTSTASYSIQRSRKWNAPMPSGQTYSSSFVPQRTRTYPAETSSQPINHHLGGPGTHYGANRAVHNSFEPRTEDSWPPRDRSAPYQFAQTSSGRVPAPSERELFEPSDAWKRQNGRDERRMSLDAPFKPTNNNGTTNLFNDRQHSGSSSSDAFKQRTINPRFRGRKPGQYSTRPGSPIRADKRNSFPGNSWRSSGSSNPNFSTRLLRRPTQRISARISARPQRLRTPSPSPSSTSISSTSSSSSSEHGSRQGSECISPRSLPHSPLPLPLPLPAVKPERQYSEDFQTFLSVPVDTSTSQNSLKENFDPPIPLLNNNVDSQILQSPVISAKNEGKFNGPSFHEVEENKFSSLSSSKSIMELSALESKLPVPPSVTILSWSTDDVHVDKLASSSQMQIDASRESPMGLVSCGSSSMSIGEGQSDSLATPMEESDTENLCNLQTHTEEESNSSPDKGVANANASSEPHGKLSEILDIRMKSPSPEGTFPQTPAPVPPSEPPVVPISSVQRGQEPDFPIDLTSQSVLVPVQNDSVSFQNMVPPQTETLNSSLEKLSKRWQDLLSPENSDSLNEMLPALVSSMKSRDSTENRAEHGLAESILQTNWALADLPTKRTRTSNEQVIREIAQNSLPIQFRNHSVISKRLAERFSKENEEYIAKVDRLRAEYKAHHIRWKAHCRKLDSLMASAASEGVPAAPIRLTRRSAHLGGVARSDFEMEQIVASLGTEVMMDPNIQAMRNMAVVPDLITLDPHRHQNVHYVDNNGLIDDPEVVFDAFHELGVWTKDEQDKYMRAYANYPKQFGIIAKSIPGKTPAQCVLLYYLLKKDLVDFRGVIAKYGKKRKRGRKTGKGKGNALLADIVKPVRGEADGDPNLQKHNDRYHTPTSLQRREMHDRRRDIISPSHCSDSFSSVREENCVQQSKQDSTPSVPLVNPPSTPRNINGSVAAEFTSPISTGTRDEDRQIFLDDVGSPIQVQPPSIDPQDANKVKVKRPPGRPPKKHKGPHPVSGTSQKTNSYTWSKLEEVEYARLLAKYGKNFAKIGENMPAKTALQCRNYYRSHAIDRGLELIAIEAEKALGSRAPTTPA